MLQSRGSRLRDVLNARDVNEIADAPAGAVQSAYGKAVGGGAEPKAGGDALSGKTSQEPEKVTMSYASVERGGKVKFEEA